MFIHVFDSSSSAHLDGSDIVWFVQENTRTGELRYPDGKPENGRHKRDVTNKPSRLWPNGIVHYAFDSRILSDSESTHEPINILFIILAIVFLVIQEMKLVYMGVYSLLCPCFYEVYCGCWPKNIAL